MTPTRQDSDGQNCRTSVARISPHPCIHDVAFVPVTAPAAADAVVVDVAVVLGVVIADDVDAVSVDVDVLIVLVVVIAEANDLLHFVYGRW